MLISVVLSYCRTAMLGLGNYLNYVMSAMLGLGNYIIWVAPLHWER